MFNQVFRRRKMLCARAEGIDRVARKLAGCQHCVDAARARVGPDLFVECRPLRAHLAHVTQHQPARRGQRDKRVNRGAHRIRVRVVRVVDDQAAMRALLALQPPLDGCKVAQRLRNHLGSDTGCQRARRRRQRIACVMQAQQRQGDDETLARSLHFNALPVGGVHHGARHGPGIHTEIEHAPRARRGFPHRRIFATVGRIARIHRHAIGRQRGQHSGVFFSHRFHADHEFLVLALRVVDHRHGRLGNGGQYSRFARMVHAEFKHGQLMLRVQAEQRERQADVVVEIAGGRQAGVFTHGLREDRGDHLLDRGLAVAARHGDDGNRELAAPAGGKLAEPEARVGDSQHGHIGDIQGGSRCARHQHGSSATRHHLGQEIVRIETLADQRDEQVARLDGAAVGRHAQDRRIGAGQMGAGHPGSGVGGAHHHGRGAHAFTPRAASARRTCS